jgi:hypothetical protein
MIGVKNTTAVSRFSRAVTLDPDSQRPEESVRLDDRSDQEQAGDEDKGGPRLAGGLENRVGHKFGITAKRKSQPPSRS